MDVGELPLLMHARTSTAGHPQLHVNYGPLQLALHDESLAIEVDGGYYGSFKCVRARARIDFDAPNLLVGESVQASVGDDTLSLAGTYDLEANKMHAELKFDG